MANVLQSASETAWTSSAFDVVICDIDGCLAPELPEVIDVERLAQVARYNRLAVERRDRPIVTVCSGRPQPFAEAICRLIHNLSVPCIAENGVWLYHPGANRYEMDPAIGQAHLEAVHAAARLVGEEYRGIGVTLQPGKSAAVTLYHPDPEVLRRIEPEVRMLLAENGWPFRVSMTWNYINCDLAHVSKTTGLRRLSAACGIPPERMAGIGDTMGDRLIAEYVAYFACPSNAQDDLKKLADYVSPREETAGVLDILERFVAK